MDGGQGYFREKNACPARLQAWTLSSRLPFRGIGRPTLQTCFSRALLCSYQTSIQLLLMMQPAAVSSCFPLSGRIRANSSAEHYEQLLSAIQKSDQNLPFWLCCLNWIQQLMVNLSNSTLGLKKHIEMITLSNPILKTRTRLVGSGISRSFGFEISSSGTWNGYAAQQNNNAKMTP